MKVTTEHEVNNCCECPYSTNTAREWDDPFTSPPSDPGWWCKHPDKGNSFLYSKEVREKIADDCPIVRQQRIEEGKEKAGDLFEDVDLDEEQIERFVEIIGGDDYDTFEIVLLIKKCLINDTDRMWLHERDLDLHDIMTGRYPANWEKRINNMLKRWNKRAGAKLFMEN